MLDSEPSTDQQRSPALRTENPRRELLGGRQRSRESRHLRRGSSCRSARGKWLVEYRNRTIRAAAYGVARSCRPANRDQTGAYTGNQSISDIYKFFPD